MEPHAQERGARDSIENLGLENLGLESLGLESLGLGNMRTETLSLAQIQTNRPFPQQFISNQALWVWVQGWVQGWEQLTVASAGFFPGDSGDGDGTR